jgi:hypothetical protein
MSVRRLDALVDAFAHLNCWHSPSSDAYQLRNPLLLKAFSPKHEKDEQGRRVFSSFASGYDNGILDVSIKCSGKSHSKLTPDSTLQDLVVVYGNSVHATRGIKNFLRAALKDDSIMESQRLGWFTEDKDANLRRSKSTQQQGVCMEKK